MDDPSDELGVERAWVRRMTRRRAEERSHERAAARAETLAATAELAGPAVQPVKRPASPSLLAHLAVVRGRGHAARWRGVDAAIRSATMAWVVRHRWARTTVEQRRAVGIALARAHWGPAPPDPKAAPGGGRYR